jgi:hypothetical protein
MICTGLRILQRSLSAAVRHIRSARFLLERMPRQCTGAKVGNQGDYPMWGRRSPVVIRRVIVRKHGAVKLELVIFWIRIVN